MFAHWKRKAIAMVQRTRVRFPFLSFHTWKSAYRFAQVSEIVRILRGPEGCPWDQKQELSDFLPFLREEALETWSAGRAALHSQEFDSFAEEMGDLHFVLLFLSHLTDEQGAFSTEDALHSIVRKMIRRHPHVFSDAPRDEASIKKAWKRIKAEEKADALRNQSSMHKTSILEGVTEDWSALRVALDVSRRVVHVGFEWPDVWDVWNKLEEEIEELKEVLPKSTVDSSSIDAKGNALGWEQSALRQRQLEELGDVLFTLVNLGRHLGLDCEEALREQCIRFTGRFQYIEDQLALRGQCVEETPLDALEELWQEAKQVRA